MAAGRAMLDESSRELVRDERVVLGRLRELLARHDARPDDISQLRQAELDLDEPFLLVVVGEFNAGKSAFINALVGATVLREGVTPTTAAITRLRFAPSQVEYRDGALLEVGYPLELLRDVAIVDTPGTTAILREHEAITSHFVPRADLILFVTSADRPFTETERLFMERIRAWGKKVVVVLNKVDLLGASQVDEQVTFVREGVERLLGFRPEVFPVSARLALLGRAAPDSAEWQASRFGSLEEFVTATLDQRGRLALKLSTPLGVGERVARTYVMAAEEKLSLLAADLAVVESIDRQLKAYREDMRSEFGHRLDEVDNVLHEMSARGVDYLDQTLRLGRVVDLFRHKVLKEEFERIVVADTPERLDRISQDLIDWMVDQDLRVWRSVTEQVERRRGEGAYGASERLAGSFEYDRRALLASLGQTARSVLQRHNHEREASQLALSVREAVTRATLLEAGAIGLGAVSMAIVGSAAADVTGLFAASIMAGVGLWLLPRKRSQAKAQFRTRTEELRSRLINALRDEFQRELERSVQRIKDALAPYDRLVRSEQERTMAFSGELNARLSELAALRARVTTLT
ncbi:MAG: dynamin family protein [Chloroflexota bacterium]|nr:dynamin family protein [Chloroflexota bacterium]